MARRSRFVKAVGIFFMAVLVLSGVLGFLYPMMSKGEKAPASTPEIENLLKSGKPFIIYFRVQGNPLCREQERILVRVLSDAQFTWRVGFTLVEYSNETVKVFEDYGIRSVPALVIVDREGFIKYIFQGGIVEERVLRNALSQVVS